MTHLPSTTKASLDWCVHSGDHSVASPRVSMLLHTPPDSPRTCSAMVSRHTEEGNSDGLKGTVGRRGTHRIRVFDGIRVSIRSKNNRHSRSSISRRSSRDTPTIAPQPTITTLSRTCTRSRQSECLPSFGTRVSVPASSSKGDCCHSVSESQCSECDTSSLSLTSVRTGTSPWKRLTTIVHKKPATSMYSISFSPWKTKSHKYRSHSEATAEWVPDTASTRCQTCLAAFSITRRRHHCRLCGGLVCNDCSLQRTFVAIFDESRRRSHSAQNQSRIVNGVPQRTCNTCATTLKNMVAQDDSRVKVLHAETANETWATLGMRYSERNRAVRVSWDREPPSLMKESRQQRQQYQLARPRATTKNAAARHEELEQVLQARSLSRVNPNTQQHVISSVWLEQWLRYVHHGSGGSANTGGMVGGKLRDRHDRPMIVRRPGPISNYSLLNFASGVLEAKEDLQRSRGAGSNGDYHVISREVWLVFLKLYGGGPSIHLKDSEIAEPCVQTSNCDTLVVSKGSSSTLTASASYTDIGLSSEWEITELNNVVSTALARARAGVQKTNMSELAPIAEQKQLIVRSTASNFFSRKSLHRNNSARGDRHTSDSINTALVLIGQPRQQNVVESSNQGRRSFWKNWRSSDDNAFNTNTVSTISQISEDVVLYDPTKVETNEKYPAISSEDSIDESIVIQNKSLSPSKSIAAISAFAIAAAEARRKSTMSLMRHSSLMSQTNTMLA